MEAFAVDKSFYDIGDSDLKELWEAELDPQAITEAFKVAADVDVEWGAALLDVKPQVILHDRLMTDAVLGSIPIKSEHSYSLTSDGDSIPDSPLSLQNKMDDMDDECFPSIVMNAATGVTRRAESPPIAVKQEPLSAPSSPETCPLSPSSIVQIRPETFTSAKVGSQQSLLKQPTILLTARTNTFIQQNRVVIPKLNIKVDSTSTGFSLPPTPPSSTTSDCEGNLSPIHHPASPGSSHVLSSTSVTSSRQQSRQQSTTRLFVSPNNSSSRQPIQTPLISNQPKGSTGMLILTEEEKRTLVAEGYPIPTRLPLTKAEEKSLKKIRRKIKNKISAQESRRKKKEYMDALEKKVEALTSENNEFKKKIETLEGTNTNLLSQLHKLQLLVGNSSNSNKVSKSSATQTATDSSVRHMPYPVTRSSVK